MALMLRMAGIPARVATGFTPGGYSSRHKAWIVRDTDAHAWVEVWFEKYGWVDIDATPGHSGPLAGRRAGRPRLAAPSPRTATPARTTPGTAAPNPISVRPELQLGRSDDQTGAVATDSGRGWLRWLGGSRRGCSSRAAVVLFLRRPRGKTPMDRAIYEVEDAMRRVGRPVTPARP